MPHQLLPTVSLFDGPGVKTGFVSLSYLDGRHLRIMDKLVRFTHPTTVTIISISIDGVKYYYLYDGLGSVTELVIREKMWSVCRYTPFRTRGPQRTGVQPAPVHRTIVWPESGLYHYRQGLFPTLAGSCSRTRRDDERGEHVCVCWEQSGEL